MPSITDNQNKPAKPKVTLAAPSPLANLSQGKNAGSMIGGTTSIASNVLANKNSSPLANLPLGKGAGSKKDEFVLNTAMPPPAHESMQTSPPANQDRKRRKKRLESEDDSNDGNTTDDALNHSEPELGKKKNKKADTAKVKMAKLETENIRLLGKVDKLERTLGEHMKLIIALTDKVDNLPVNLAPVTAPPPPKQLFTSLFNPEPVASPPPLTIEERNIFHAIRVDQLDSANRENNILLMGVERPDSTLNPNDKAAADNSRIQSIFSNIGLDPRMIKSWYRFNKKNDSIHEPIIKVELYYKQDVATVLKASRRLKDSSSTSKVYINLDLTPAQRQAEKELITIRNDLNKKIQLPKTHYFGIRNGVLKKIPLAPLSNQHVKY